MCCASASIYRTPGLCAFTVSAVPPPRMVTLWWAWLLYRPAIVALTAFSFGVEKPRQRRHLLVRRIDPFVGRGINFLYLPSVDEDANAADRY